MPSGSSSVFGLLDNSVSSTKKDTYKTIFKIKDIDKNIINKALRQFDVFRFNTLKSYFPNLNSLSEFITSMFYLGNIEVIAESSNKTLNNEQYLKSCMTALNVVAENISNINISYQGTEEFFAQYIHKVISNKRRYIENPQGEGEGISQNSTTVNNSMRIDLSNKDWYVFNDNYGTSEEKRFVAYFDRIVDDLKDSYDRVYLIRNERQLAIYTFETGERFEPDYILILQKSKVDGYQQHQIFVEPKGENLIPKDIWKEELLLSLKKRAIPTVEYSDDNEYKVWGLPFFNHVDRKLEFDEVVEELKLKK